jgi:DNA-binding NarL/FixJ family response regulator
MLSQRAISAYVGQPRQVLEPVQSPLTSREQEILGLAAEGHSSSVIAERLSISRRTVETHRANIMKKLGLHNQTEIVHYALKQGFLSVDFSEKRPRLLP